MVNTLNHQTSDGVYACTPSSALFLVKKSPAYVYDDSLDDIYAATLTWFESSSGGAAEFLAAEEIMSFKNVAQLVRSGTTQLPNGGTTAADHQVMMCNCYRDHAWCSLF